jgi:hypothetical protein
LLLLARVARWLGAAALVVGVAGLAAAPLACVVG